MAMIKNKKAIAFSFVVFFIGIVLFAYLEFSMNNDKYTKDADFIKYRINHLNGELKYFKNTYLKNTVSFSLYNTIYHLNNYTYTNPSTFNQLNKNYSKFNKLIKEGMLNGSFDSNSQDFLNGINDGQNKTVNFFLNEYIENFNNNNKVNLTFNINDINIFEKTPYYLSLQLKTNWSLKTKDNISYWENKEEIIVSVPITDLPVPDFLYNEDTFIKTKSSEYNLADSNWTLSNFKKTINNSYTSIFLEPDHKYTIGNSYLKRILNISESSFKNVILSLNFDYDIEEQKIYDTSLYNNNYSDFYFSNLRLLYNFNNEYTNNTEIYDLSNYNNTGELNGGITANISNSISKESFKLDGTNDNINITNFQNITKDISIFAWVYLNSTNPVQKNPIVCAQNEYFCYHINNDTSVEIKLNTTNYNGTYNSIYFQNNTGIEFDKWNHIGFTYDGNNTILYVNGLKYTTEVSNRQSTKYSGKLKSPSNFHSVLIGENSKTGNNLKGLVDELVIFSKVLTRNDISNLYKNRKAYNIDYQKSLYGLGVYFDGKDDYINLGNNHKYNFNSDLISIEMWVKFNNISGKQTLIDKGNSSNGWGVEIIKGNISIGNHAEGTAITKKIINKTDYWYHLVINGFDNSKPEIYVNNKNYSVSQVGDWPESTSTNYNLTIGKKSAEDLGYLNGVIDEIKIYNNSLNKQQIYKHYFNYESFSKGCCNYIILFNPNKFGYNQSSYIKNISYSTRLFYDYHLRNRNHNITLWNVSNVTTYNTNEKYYNFVFDQCIQRAFSVSNYQTESNNIELKVHKMNGRDNASCSDLVKLGIY